MGTSILPFVRSESLVVYYPVCLALYIVLNTSSLVLSARFSLILSYNKDVLSG